MKYLHILSSFYKTNHITSTLKEARITYSNFLRCNIRREDIFRYKSQINERWRMIFKT